MMNSLNQLGERFDGVEKRLGERLASVEGRLGRIERNIYIAIGVAIGIGLIVGILSRLISFDFVVSIQPHVNP